MSRIASFSPSSRSSAQVQAAGFYKKLGYVQVGDEYLDEHCPHVNMEKPLDSAPADPKE